MVQPLGKKSDAEYVLRSFELHDLQFREECDLRGKREALKRLAAEVGIDDEVNSDRFDDIEFLSKAFTYLKHLPLDPSINCGRIEQFLQQVKDYISEQKGTFSRLEYGLIENWVSYFKAYLAYRDTDFERAKHETMKAYALLSDQDPSLNDAVHWLLFELDCFVRPLPLLMQKWKGKKFRTELFNSLFNLSMVSLVRLCVPTGNEVHLSRVPSYLDDFFNWDQEKSKALRGDHVKNLQNKLSEYKPFRKPLFHLEAYIIAGANGEWETVSSFMKVDTIRRFDAGSVKAGGAYNSYLEFVVTLLRLLEENDKSKQLDALLYLYKLKSKLPSLEMQWLAFSCCIRLAKKIEQNSIAQRWSEEFNERISIQRVKLHPSFLPSVGGEFITFPSSDEDHKDEPLITTKSLRIAKITQVVMSLLTQRMFHRFQAIFVGDENRQRLEDKSYQKSLRVLVDQLGGLKGPAMKLGQVVCMFLDETSLIGEEQSQSLYHANGHLDQESIIAHIETAYAKSFDSVFAKFEFPPIAVGSMAQVHKAVLCSGETVAVKIGFPNIAKVVESDMKAIQILDPLFRLVFPAADLKSLHSKGKEKFLEECDFRQEFAHHKYFFEIAESMDGIIVPALYEDLCQENVLVMEYIDGETFDQVKESSDQEMKNAYASRILHFLYRSYFKYGLAYGDPHPANFLFKENGEIAVLDFGFCDHVSSRRRLLYSELYNTVMNGEMEAFRKCLIDLEVAAIPENFDFPTAMKTLKSLYTYGLEESVKMTREHTTQFRKSTTTQAKNRKFVNLPAEDLVTVRMMYYSQSLASQLGAEIPFGQIVKEEFNGELEGEPSEKAS